MNNHAPPRLVHVGVGIDAAGQYAENLLQWLHQLDLNTTISVGQPARNKAYRKVGARRCGWESPPIEG